MDTVGRDIEKFNVPFYYEVCKWKILLFEMD